MQLETAHYQRQRGVQRRHGGVVEVKPLLQRVDVVYHQANGLADRRQIAEQQSICVSCGDLVADERFNT